MTLNRIIKGLFLTAFVLFTLLACKKSQETKNFIKLNGIEYSINEGFASNLSSSHDSLGIFKITLNDNIENPQNTFVFRLFSTSKTEITEGTYTYYFWPESSYAFSFVELKTSDGDSLNEYNSSWSGQIYVSRENENFCFELDLLTTPFDDENTSTIKGHFTGLLSEK